MARLHQAQVVVSASLEAGLRVVVAGRDAEGGSRPTRFFQANGRRHPETKLASEVAAWENEMKTRIRWTFTPPPGETVELVRAPQRLRGWSSSMRS